MDTFDDYRKTIISNILNTVLSKYTVKCGRASQAKKHGAKFNENFVTNYDGDTGDAYGIRKLTYDNGIEIEFNEDTGDILSFTNADGHRMNYLGEDSYDFFEKQAFNILDRNRDDFYFLMNYADKYASVMGMALNSYVRGKISKTELEDRINRAWMSEEGDYEFMTDNYPRFLDLCKSIDLPDNNFFSLRVVNRLHDNDSLDKGIVWDKGHTSTTTGAEMDMLGNFADIDDCWKVITDYSNSEGNVKGVFFGKMLEDKRGRDWECEVHHAPGQRFERVLIDEKNKIIVQVPYKNP